MALSSFGDFKEFTVQPLTKEEAFDLLKKYDEDSILSKQLIKKLKEPLYKDIDEFLRNPLLVSLLFAAFEHKQIIPIKKHIFYRQVYDALFESHDLTKGDSFAREKFSKLDIDEFHRVLRHIGYNCMVKGKIEFTKDEILLVIKEAKLFAAGLDFKESDLLKDLINTVPLFIIDGIYYKWSHKSLQEYFAAQFIYVDSKEKQKQILLKFYNHKDFQNYLNILDLYYSIDYKSFNEVIIHTLLVDFLQHMKSSYRSFSDKAKIDRQLLTFGYDFVLIKSEFQKGDQSKPTQAIWAKIKTEFNNSEKWVLRISPVPNEESMNYIKVPVKTKTSAQLLHFLAQKKEKIVLPIEAKPRNFNTKIDLQEEKIYLVNDDKKSILNTPQNFEVTNNIILHYNGRLFLTINQKEAINRLKKIKECVHENTLDKLLAF